MKRWKKVILIVGLCLSFSGLIFVQIGYKAGGFQSLIENNTKEERFALQEKELHSFTELEADFDTLDISIKESDTKQAYVSYYNVNDHSPLKFSNRDGQLRLTENRKVTSPYKNRIRLVSIRDLIFWLQQKLTDQPNDPYQVILYLPRGSKLDKASLKMNSGDTKLARLSVKTLSLEAKNSDVSISGSTFKNGKMTIRNGDFKTAHSQFQNGTVLISNGDSKLSTVSMDSCAFESTNGDIKIEEATVTDSQFSLKEGDIKAKKISFKGINTISNQNGDSKIELASYSLFVTAQSQNGDSTVSGKALTHYKSDNRLTLSNINGDIKVR